MRDKLVNLLQNPNNLNSSARAFLLGTKLFTYFSCFESDIWLTSDRQQHRFPDSEAKILGHFRFLGIDGDGQADLLGGFNELAELAEENSASLCVFCRDAIKNNRSTDADWEESQAGGQGFAESVEPPTCVADRDCKCPQLHDHRNRVRYYEETMEKWDDLSVDEQEMNDYWDMIADVLPDCKELKEHFEAFFVLSCFDKIKPDLLCCIRVGFMIEQYFNQMKMGFLYWPHENFQREPGSAISPFPRQLKTATRDEQMTIYLTELQPSCDELEKKIAIGLDRSLNDSLNIYGGKSKQIDAILERLNQAREICKLGLLGTRLYPEQNKLSRDENETIFTPRQWSIIELFFTSRNGRHHEEQDIIREYSSNADVNMQMKEVQSIRDPISRVNKKLKSLKLAIQTAGTHKYHVTDLSSSTDAELNPPN